MRKPSFVLRKIAGSLLVLLPMAAAFASPEAELQVPPMRQPLSLKILLLPKKTGEQVRFTFHKQDQNGYGGADNLGWRILSPSGNCVCAGSIPDDGNTDPNWKPGPRQVVECIFTPMEPGIHQLQFLMDCDAYLHFSCSRAEGLNWALTNGNFRTSRVSGEGNVPLKGWFYLPVQEPGESRDLTFIFSYMHYSKLAALSISTPERTLLTGYDNPPAPEKTRVYGRTFPVKRMRSSELYEIRAKAFDVIGFQAKDFPPLVWFFRREDAAAFQQIFGCSKAAETARFFRNCPKGESSAEVAFAPGTAYSAEFLPDVPGNFQGTVTVGTKSFPLSQERSRFRFRTGAEEEFCSLVVCTGVPGKLVFSRVDPKESMILAPANGTLVPGNLPLTVQVREAEGVSRYSVELFHESGKKITRTGAAPEFRFASGELSPGVWEAVARPGENRSVFAVTEPAETTPVWAFGYKPAMDSSVKQAEQISLKTAVSHSKLDFKRSCFIINGVRHAPRTVGPRRLGVAGLKLPAGPVAVKAELTDKAGNRSVYEWNFFLGVPAQKRLAFDANGFLQINGRGFIPQIIYPPEKTPDDSLGFNTMLPNTLTELPTLDRLLSRNCKSLDSGCLYRGYYTAPDSTPLLDADRYMQGPGGSHPARLGAWLDEADVHLRDAETAAQLNVFRRFGKNAGVNGVCTALATRYPAMAALGDYLMVDSYPNENVLSLDSTFLEAIAAARGKPVWQLNQGFDPDKTTQDAEKFRPNRSQMKYAHWAVFRHGLQGVGLYTEPVKVQTFPELFAFVCDLYRASGTLAFALLSPGVQTDCQVSAPLASRLLRHENRVYLIVQNASLHPCRGTIQVRGNFEPKVRVLFDNRVLRQKNGGFQDVFEPLASRIYELQCCE